MSESSNPFPSPFPSASPDFEPPIFNTDQTDFPAASGSGFDISLSETRSISFIPEPTEFFSDSFDPATSFGFGTVFESASLSTSDGQQVTVTLKFTETIQGPRPVESESPSLSPSTVGAQKAPVGAIVGGVIGGIFGLFLIGILVFLLLIPRRKRNKLDRRFTGNFDPDYVAAAVSAGDKHKYGTLA